MSTAGFTLEAEPVRPVNVDRSLDEFELVTGLTQKWMRVPLITPGRCASCGRHSITRQPVEGPGIENVEWWCICCVGLNKMRATKIRVVQGYRMQKPQAPISAWSQGRE